MPVCFHVGNTWSDQEKVEASPPPSQMSSSTLGKRQSGHYHSSGGQWAGYRRSRWIGVRHQRMIRKVLLPPEHLTHWCAALYESTTGDGLLWTQAHCLYNLYIVVRFDWYTAREVNDCFLAMLWSCLPQHVVTTHWKPHIKVSVHPKLQRHVFLLSPNSI